MRIQLNGYWTKKDNSCYVFIEKTFKAGYVTGFRYFKRLDGKEVIDLQPFRTTHEDLQENYTEGMKD